MLCRICVGCSPLNPVPRFTSSNVTTFQDVNLRLRYRGALPLTHMVRLHIDGECDVESVPWLAVDSDQDHLEEDDLVTADGFIDSEVGTVLALQDRNNLVEDWPGRRVFVVMGVSCACIFDEDGTPIDEPEEYVVAGKHLLVHEDDEAKTFAHDWNAGFYRYDRILFNGVSDGDDSDGEDKRGADKSGADKSGGRVDANTSVLPAIAAVGNRIKIAMGTPAKWYSGQVFNDDSRSNAILVAFDDGDLQSWTHEEMAAELAATSVQAAVEAEKGVIKNVQGYSFGVALVYSNQKQGVFTSWAAGRKAVGVMSGDTGLTLGGCKVYESFTALSGAFTAAEAEAATAGTKRLTRGGKSAGK